jgi:hypothetical protein
LAYVGDSGQIVSHGAITQRLRSLGPIGAFLANVVTFLTTNWVLTMSTAAGLWAGLSDWAVGFAADPRVRTGVAVFLVLLWTYVGIITSLIAVAHA